jgi:hypothetical protein
MPSWRSAQLKHKDNFTFTFMFTCTFTFHKALCPPRMGIRGGQLHYDHTTGNLPRRTKTRDLHMAFKTPYLHDFFIKLCRQQETVILNYENFNICDLG